MTIRTRLTDRSWWGGALLRGLYTAIAVALPYLGAATLVEVPWLTVASTAALAFIVCLATSLAGLPEVEGVDLPWWFAAVERVVKTFAQALVSGFGGAVLLTDVDWLFVLQAAALAALVSLLRLVLATLPADPTRARVSSVVAQNLPLAPEGQKTKYLGLGRDGHIVEVPDEDPPTPAT